MDVSPAAGLGLEAGPYETSRHSPTISADAPPEQAESKIPKRTMEAIESKIDFFIFFSVFFCLPC
jgi:hypothetical protein